MSKLFNSKILILIQRYKIQTAISLIFLGLLIIFFIANVRAFTSPYTYTSIFAFVPFVIIPALALTYLIICGEIDLSFPSIMGFGSWIFSVVTLSTGYPLLGLFSGLVAGAIAGLLNGLLVTKIRIPSLILTLGTMYMWSGITMIGCEGRPISLLSLVETMFYKFFIGEIYLVPTQMLWAIGLAIVFWIFLNTHKFGAHVYFTGDNIRGAKLMGINTDKVKILCFTLMGVFSAFAGILAALKMANFWPGIGEGYLMLAIAAVVVGGTPITGGYGTIYGTVIGAILIQMVVTGVLSAGFTGFWTQFVIGLTIVVALAVQSILRGSLQMRAKKLIFKIKK